LPTPEVHQRIPEQLLPDALNDQTLTPAGTDKTVELPCKGIALPASAMPPSSPQPD
jgi:hypothetical protein